MLSESPDNYVIWNKPILKQYISMWFYLTVLKHKIIEIEIRLSVPGNKDGGGWEVTRYNYMCSISETQHLTLIFQNSGILRKNHFLMGMGFELRASCL
jgi:hypothetical protein